MWMELIIMVIIPSRIVIYKGTIIRESICEICRAIIWPLGCHVDDMMIQVPAQRDQQDTRTPEGT
jgi:hypothetical protein